MASRASSRRIRCRRLRASVSGNDHAGGREDSLLRRASHRHAWSGRAVRGLDHLVGPMPRAWVYQAQSLAVEAAFSAVASGSHRRRVHGTSHGRSKVERRPAPGRRGQREGRRKARTSDCRFHYVPVTIFIVPYVVGHDGYRLLRSEGVVRHVPACVEINQCVGCTVRNRHRHAIEQASRRWRGDRRDNSARTHRKI